MEIDAGDAVRYANEILDRLTTRDPAMAHEIAWVRSLIRSLLKSHRDYERISEELERMLSTLTHQKDMQQN